MASSVITEHGEIKYVLERKPVKNINFRVKSDGHLHISAAKNVPVKYIEGLISKKSRFFAEAIKKTEARAARSSPGDSFTLLGRQLKLVTIADGESYCEENGGALFIHCAGISESGQVLNRFILKTCMAVFEEANRAVAELYNARGYSAPLLRFTVKTMKSRWGSCNPNKKHLSINSRLISYPKECITAVFCHEYAHLFEMNHSEAFYRILLDVMPDYYRYHDMLKE